MRQIKSLLFGALFAFSVGGAAAATAVPATAAAEGESCYKPILTFPVWYRGLAKNDCSLKSPAEVGGIGPYIYKIALNAIEIALQLVGYIAVGFIIYGGFQYLTSAGSDQTAAARKTIINACVGLGISIASVGIVNLIVGKI